MYKIFSKISYIVRFCICFVTIEAVPIYKSDLIGLIFGQVFPTYVILLLISYAIVGIIYKKGSEPTLGVILYFIVYVSLVAILWIILALLTQFRILPV